MSRRPRTPVYFPRMKVRGRRNKAKLHARHVTNLELRVRVHQVDPYTVELIPDPIFGTHLVTSKTTRDGYCRTVKEKTP